MARINRKKRLLAIVLAMTLAILGYVGWRRSRLEQYQVIQSPDARFRLVVYRRPVWPATMPGQASDAPGIVRLYDRSGQMLQETRIGMVQQMNDLQWSPERVEVPLVFSWKLPK